MFVMGGDLTIPTLELTCSEFKGCNSVGGDGTVFTGDNGFKVCDPYHPTECWEAGKSQMLTWGVAQNEMGTIPGIPGCEQGPPCAPDCASPFNSFGDQYTATACQLAPLPPPPTFKNQKCVRPTPAHFVMTAHALTFGALSATSKLFQGNSKGWTADFKQDSTEAADTVTPLGGHFLKTSL